MTARKRFWPQLREHLLHPKVDDQRLENCLREVRQQLPIPVFWLLGKAQSGKTSLIRALTGSTRAEIGNGFRPCTRTAQLYSFPQEDDCLLKFLDTRGLGEIDYDPSEDIQLVEGQAHVLIVVVKALDHAQQCVLEPLQKILRAHPSWPLIVVQSSLHEAYAPSTGDLTGQGPAVGRHVVPYPFSTFPYPPSVPQGLARSLAAQRELFPQDRARFVPADFTLPEDGYNVEHYGLEALWSAVEQALPLGLRGMLQEQQDARQSLRDMFFRTARPHIVSYSIAAGAAAALPVPMIDLPLLVSIQAKLFQTLASIYHQPASPKRMAEIVSMLGIGYLARIGGRELLKFIPGFGSLAAGLYSAASTYALGCTLCTYFSRVQQGDVPDADWLRKLYAEQFEEGRRRLGPYLDRWTPSHRAEASRSQTESEAAQSSSKDAPSR